MEKVLLAIDGIAPDKKAFSYAVALCQRIKDELKILQVIRQEKTTGWLLGFVMRRKDNGNLELVYQKKTEI